MFVIFAAMLLHLSGVVALSDTRLTQPTTADLMRDPVVLSFCRVLVNQARSERDAEQAAFIVRTSQGTLYFVWWPSNGERNSVQWRGPVPEGAVALVHSHPSWLPMPSRLDMATAGRTRLPVYVVTPFLISRTTGGPAEVVSSGEWMKP